MCRGTEQFSETELIIPVVNNASHAADAVPTAGLCGSRLFAGRLGRRGKGFRVTLHETLGV